MYKHGYEEKNLPLPRIKDQPSRSQPAGSYLGPHTQHTSFSHTMFNYSLNLKFNLHFIIYTTVNTTITYTRFYSNMFRLSILCCGKLSTPARRVAKEWQKPNPTHHRTKEAGNHFGKNQKEAQCPEKLDTDNVRVDRIRNPSPLPPNPSREILKQEDNNL